MEGLSVYKTIKSLEIGKDVTFPAEKISSVRNVCTTYGLVWNRKFTTKTNREQRTINVLRLA